MKKLFRPLLVLVLGYALLTGFQMFLKVPMDGRLILAKLLLAILATAVIELLNRQPLAVRDVKAGHGQHGDAHFMEPEEVKRVYQEVQQGHEAQPAMLVGASKSTWLVDTSDQSVLMVAPPGAGKSTSLYIPTITYNARVNLRTQDAQGIGQGASMVLVSVKDDLYTITSAELKKCGYRVLKLDLRNVFCSCHFNLLYRVNIEIDAWRKEQDAKQRAVHYATAERYAKVIASAIIGNTGSVNSGDSSEYFNETARGLITGLVLLVSQYGQDGERHIVSVFNLIVELAGADNPEKGNTVQKSRLAAMLEGVTDRRIKLTELRLGMRMGFDESSYDDPSLSLRIIKKRRVHQLRDWAREQGLLPPMYYEDPVHGIDKNQLRELLIGIANGIMPDTYGLKLIKLHKCGPRVLREMRLCREAGMTGKEIRPYWALGVKKLQEVRAAFLAEKETDDGQ